MSEEKIYVGGAKEVSGNFGEFHKLSFNRDDVQKLMNNLNDKGWVNVNMNRRKEVSQYGQTHSLVIDTWQPTQQQAPPQQQQQYQQHQAPPQQQQQMPVQQFQQMPQPQSVPQEFKQMAQDDCPF